MLSYESGPHGLNKLPSALSPDNWLPSPSNCDIRYLGPEYWAIDPSLGPSCSTQAGHTCWTAGSLHGDCESQRLRILQVEGEFAVWADQLRSAIIEER
jgi:hypothetical protein